MLEPKDTHGARPIAIPPGEPSGGAEPAGTPEPRRAGPVRQAASHAATPRREAKPPAAGIPAAEGEEAAEMKAEGLKAKGRAKGKGEEEKEEETERMEGREKEGREKEGREKEGREKEGREKGKAKAKAEGAGEGKVGARASGPSRKDLLQDLQGELAALRSNLDEILVQLTLKLQGRLAVIQTRVAGTSASGDPVPPLTLAMAGRALALARDLKIRPRKGRLKDVVRVAGLVDALRKGLRKR